ncbi:MAG: efflux RND transporter periplasmic adaptor subunit [Lutibacter sp.]|nr:efflux RND transporter periplasmic adaptor subunit [Lutibacter sp.]
MNKIIISFVFIALLITSCNNTQSDKDHGHPHNEDTSTEIELESLAYTLYSKKIELFVEFKPLIVGKTSKFAAHFTTLGDNFKAVTEGSVTVRLEDKINPPTNKADNPSSPGIFRLALKPKYTGKFQLVFEIVTENFTDKIILENVTVYRNLKSALANTPSNTIGEEIVYLKEQAWKTDFSNKEILKQDFSEIIKTTGKIVPAQGDEVIITANSSGIITFGNNKNLIGTNVNKGETLFIISGSDLTTNNLDIRYKEAKARFEKNKIDFERANELIKDAIISQKEFLEIQLNFKNAQIKFNNISNNYTKGGQKIKSPIKGFIKNILVSEGSYVVAGQMIASVSQNRKLILIAEVPQKHFFKLNSISSANFKTAYSNTVYSTENLNGKLISYGKNINNNAYYLPVNFEIDNQGDLIPGSFIEIFLKTSIVKNALVIPYSALIEEQGTYYAYVQTSGEGFQKRELKLGANDGFQVQVLSGINENERVVVKGASQIKLATMSGKMPAHGHEH